MDSQEFGSIIPALEGSYWDYALVVGQVAAPVGVYMAGGASTSGTAGEAERSTPPDNPLLIPVSAVNAAVRTTEIEAARAELLYEVRRMEAERYRLEQVNQGIQQERQRIAALAATQRQVDSQTQACASQPTIELPPTPATGDQPVARILEPSIDHEAQQLPSQRPRRFHTPQGHYQSPVDNMYAAANILTQMVPTSDDPITLKHGVRYRC